MTEFEKARDEANNQRIEDTFNTSIYDAYEDGADWAYEWLTNPQNGMPFLTKELSGLRDHIALLEKRIYNLRGNFEKLDAGYEGMFGDDSISAKEEAWKYVPALVKKALAADDELRGDSGLDTE